MPKSSLFLQGHISTLLHIYRNTSPIDCTLSSRCFRDTKSEIDKNSFILVMRGAEVQLSKKS